MISYLASRGSVDEVAYLDANSGSSRASTDSIPFGSLITLRGWAALNEDLGPATGVFAIVDGGAPVEMMRGIEREDVAITLGDDRYRKTGFRGILSTCHLSLGLHSLRVAIRSVDGSFLDFATEISFAIVESLEQQLLAAPIAPVAAAMAVDEMRVGVRNVSTPMKAVQGDIVHIRGWAVDKSAGALAHAIYAIVGSVVIHADYGGARPDVASEFRDDRLTNCGFELAISLHGIAPGHHTIRIRVVGVAGHEIYEGDRIAIEVAPSAAPIAAPPNDLAARGMIDKIAVFDSLGNVIDPPAPLTLWRSNQLFLSGWAIDEQSDALARAVEISVDGLKFDNGVYGLNRRDVAQHFLRPDLGACGFAAIVPTDALAVGVHSATVRVVDQSGIHFYDLEPTVEFFVIESESEA